MHAKSIDLDLYAVSCGQLPYVMHFEACVYKHHLQFNIPHGNKRNMFVGTRSE